MNGKSFLAAGDVLINPALIAYAAVETDSEGAHLRLGFAGQAGTPQAEVVLEGLEARSILRWLRGNAEFLDSGPPRPASSAARPRLLREPEPVGATECSCSAGTHRARG